MRLRVGGRRQILAGALALAVLTGSAIGASAVAQAQETGKLPILDYLASLRGTPTQTITLIYRNEPMDGTRRVDFHRDDTLVLDPQGNSSSITRSTVSELPNEERSFADFSYTRYGDGPWQVGLSRSGPPAPGVRHAEGLLLYFTGSDQYPNTSIGKVSGDWVVFTGNVQDEYSKPAVLETRCLLVPVQGQPLCRILLDGKLNATIDYAPTGATIERPTVKRLLPADYKPQTHRFKTSATLRKAVAQGLPPIAKVRAVYGKDTKVEIVPGHASPGAIAAEVYYIRGNQVVARLSAVSTPNYDLYLHSQGATGTGGKFTFNKSRSLAIIDINFPGYKETRVYKPQGGYVMVARGEDRTTAMKLISLLG